MDVKELVSILHSIEGVSVHDPSPQLISIGNSSGFNPRIQVKNIVFADKVKTKKGESAVRLSFFDNHELLVTSSDFEFSLLQTGKVKVKHCPPFASVSQLSDLINDFSRASKNPNQDEVMGSFYLAYYALQSASLLGFELDRLNSQLHDYP